LFQLHELATKLLGIGLYWRNGPHMNGGCQGGMWVGGGNHGGHAALPGGIGNGLSI